MTSQLAPALHTADAGASAHPQKRLLALSGVVFVPFLVVGCLLSPSNTPHYTASDQAWTNWAHHNEYRGRISAFAMLLAAFIFFYWMGIVRSVLDAAESQARGAAQLARVAYAGALTGIVGMTMAFVTLAAASSEGSNANPLVSRAVTTGAAGAFLVAAMGFAAFLMAAGVLTLRSEVLARWTGIVALIGAASFLITSLTVLNGTANGSAFGYAFFPAIVSLLTWTTATSIAGYRAADDLAGAVEPA